MFIVVFILASGRMEPVHFRPATSQGTTQAVRRFAGETDQVARHTFVEFVAVASVIRRRRFVQFVDDEWRRVPPLHGRWIENGTADFDPDMRRFVPMPPIRPGERPIIEAMDRLAVITARRQAVGKMGSGSV
jgi:hypothetical protein